jgi:hypothetical protein
VDRVREAGIGVIAVTDHYTVANVVETRVLARQAGIRCITGVEVTTIINQDVYQILGIGIDPENRELVAFFEESRKKKGGPECGFDAHVTTKRLPGK